VKPSKGADALAEIPDIEPRPRLAAEVAAARKLERVAAEDPNPPRALDRITKYARAFLLRRGFE
jgi:hypothetical protein